MTGREAPFSAVLFDLWGTLIPGITGEELDEVSSAMAAKLGVDGRAFAGAYRRSHGERFVGALGDLRATVLSLARRCGGEPSAAALDAAASLRLDLTRRHLTSDSATLAVLDELRRRGLRLGLVSDCSWETPALWPSSPLSSRLDGLSFSCLVGVRKPDPSLFAHALAAVSRSPDECLYVGDGDGHELSGAEAVGMTALRLRTPSDTAHRYAGDPAFSGPEIARLDELLGLPALIPSTEAS